MKVYGFVNCHFYVNGFELTGFAKDDAVKMKFLTDRATYKVGADGRMAVAFSADKSGEITVKFHQTAPANKFLQGLVDLQGGGPNTFVPCAVLFRDTYRQDIGSGQFGFIMTTPEVTRGNEIAEQEWVIVVERLDLLLGDPAFLGVATALAEVAS